MNFTPSNNTVVSIGIGHTVKLLGKLKDHCPTGGLRELLFGST